MPRRRHVGIPLHRLRRGRRLDFCGTPPTTTATQTVHGDGIWSNGSGGAGATHNPNRSLALGQPSQKQEQWGAGVARGADGWRPRLSGKGQTAPRWRLASCPDGSSCALGLAPPRPLSPDHMAHEPVRGRRESAARRSVRVLSRGEAACPSVRTCAEARQAALSCQKDCFVPDRDWGPSSFRRPSKCMAPHGQMNGGWHARVVV